MLTLTATLLGVVVGGALSWFLQWAQWKRERAERWDVDRKEVHHRTAVALRQMQRMVHTRQAIRSGAKSADQVVDKRELGDNPEDVIDLLDRIEDAKAAVDLIGTREVRDAFRAVGQALEDWSTELAASSDSVATGRLDAAIEAWFDAARLDLA